MKSIINQIADKISKWEKYDVNDNVFLSDYLYLREHPDVRFLVIKYSKRVDVQLELINNQNGKYLLFSHNKRDKMILKAILAYLSE